MHPLNKYFVSKVAVFFAPAFIVWFFLAGSIIVPTAISLNKLWFTPVYQRFDAKLVQLENEQWQLKTRFFIASKPYAHNSYQPNLNFDGETTVMFGDFKMLTLCLPIFWLLFFAYKPSLTKLLVGSGYLFAFIVVLIGLNLFYQVTKVLVEGGEQLMLINHGYVYVPNKPPKWLFQTLKPIVDASVNFLVLIAPIYIWLRLYWNNFRNLGAKKID